MFSKREIEPELLDHCDPELARVNLADIVRINQRFGGHAAIRYLLKQVADRRDRFSLLDVGAASGDTAQIIRQDYPNATVTSLDRNALNLESAPHPKLLADAFALPFPPGSFDFVLCSLFLHHFTDAEVRALLHGFFLVARNAVLVADLERHWLPYVFMGITKPIFHWSPVTVHDGRCSVRAAFRAGELSALAKDAGLLETRVKVHRPAFRVTLVAPKTEATRN
jgi:2-polyprenyl-3-methyl-5-hydroxy-6-metoxy-1,4-benzoquinol methylase